MLGDAQAPCRAAATTHKMGNTWRQGDHGARSGTDPVGAYLGLDFAIGHDVGLGEAVVHVP